MKCKGNSEAGNKRTSYMKEKKLKNSVVFNL